MLTLLPNIQQQGKNIFSHSAFLEQSSGRGFITTQLQIMNVHLFKNYTLLICCLAFYCWLFALLYRRSDAGLAAAQTKESPGTLFLFRNAQGISKREFAYTYIKTHTLNTQWKPSFHSKWAARGWVWTEGSRVENSSWRNACPHQFPSAVISNPQ